MKAFHSRIACGFFLLLAFSLGIESLLTVNTDTQNIVDNFGRTRIFHGVNVVYKTAPFHPVLNEFDPARSLTDKDIKDLASWGVTAVRLGVMWPGVEPENGKYNFTYLNTMKTIVDKLGSFGIYSIIDLHQDLLTRYYCGEGVPDWIVDPADNFPVPVLGNTVFPTQSGYPNITQCLSHTFAEYYFSEAVSKLFQDFYDNKNGSRTKLEQYWSTVSSVFNTSEYVLGYELINEPWPGDIYAKPSLLEPSVADKVNLMPLYETLNTAIRSVDNKHIIFFEKSLTDLAGATGFSDVPGGSSFRNRSVYSYHVYCAPDDKEGNPTNVVLCDAEDAVQFFVDYKDSKRLGGGGFMTEFGALGNVTNSIEALEFLLALSDEVLQSWTYWQFKTFEDYTTQGTSEAFYDEHGKLQLNKVKTLARTYAPAIAGTPLLMKFSPSDATFELQYIMDTIIPAPTTIYASSLWYPKGVKVEITPSSLATYNISGNFINIYPSQFATAGNGTTLTVRVATK